MHTRVCEHVKKLELLCTKLNFVTTCSTPSLTGNKTGFLSVIMWELQTESAQSYMEIHSVTRKKGPFVEKFSRQKLCRRL
jgi:hypothetical protein